MRSLTEVETKLFFEKLSKYIGDNVKQLLERSDGDYCFRLHEQKVYYVRAEVMMLAATVPRERLISVGSCFGQFTKTDRFMLHITALDFLVPYCSYKITVKKAGENNFLYGKNVYRTHMLSITDNTPKYQGLIVYNASNIPLGFGAAAKSASECRSSDPMAVVCFHQADIAAYIRDEGTI